MDCGIWSEEHPEAYEKTPLHPAKVGVWCAIHTRGVIDPYFVENAEEQRVTTNGIRYRAMLKEYFSQLSLKTNKRNSDSNKMALHAILQTKTIALLQEQFGD